MLAGTIGWQALWACEDHEVRVGPSGDGDEEVTDKRLGGGS